VNRNASRKRSFLFRKEKVALANGESFV